MAMTNAMRDVVYDKMNFNYDFRANRHPQFLTERYYFYHLIIDETGRLTCLRDRRGEPIRSPRKLRSMCMHRLVTDLSLTVLSKANSHLLPTNVYPLLLTEAIFVREPAAIEWLISTWPMRVLRVYDVIPLEDALEDDYLTLPFDANEEVSLVDCIVLGLLKLRKESNLKFVDFTKFDKDRKLCKELSRLPILWMKPSERTVEKIHTYLSESLDITKDKVQSFLNRISAVYSNIDGEFKHGNDIEPITILLDLHVSIDDVPIGLSLQRHCPFKFTCRRLWMKPVADVEMSLLSLGDHILDSNNITHFEYENTLLSYDACKVSALLETVQIFANLRVLSLPDCIDATVNETIASQFNGCLKSLVFLQRLNLSYCNVKNTLSSVLTGLNHRSLVYLNLKDCRLTEHDLIFLANWRLLPGLRELNLSCNDLHHLDQVVVAMLERMQHVTCFSISFCSLAFDSQVLLARECKECSRIKVLCMQGYTPPSHDQVMQLLHICSQIRSLQKVVLFPESYAFPGNVEHEREINKYHTLRFSYRYLEMHGRCDIQLE